MESRIKRPYPGYSGKRIESGRRTKAHMRLLMAAAWVALLFILTCAAELGDPQQLVSFQFNPAPEARQWLLTYAPSEGLLIRKVGHFLCFAVLQCLMFRWTGELKRSTLWSLGVAVGTEAVQPFFTRGGRILDMLVDAAGILIVTFGIWAVRWYAAAKKKKAPQAPLTSVRLGRSIFFAGGRSRRRQ
jgi:VanZ family protein